MAATAITTTTQDITGDFDLVVRGTTTALVGPTILKALGTGGTDFVVAKQLTVNDVQFVKNTGTNAYKLAAAVSGLTVEFSQ